MGGGGRAVGMPSKVRQMDDGKYGTLRLIRGGQYGKPNRKRPPSDKEKQLDSRMHGAFLRLVTDEGIVASRGIQEVREHRQAPWRILARRIWEAKQAGVPKGEVKAVLDTLGAWADELWQDEQSGGNHPPRAA